MAVKKVYEPVKPKVADSIEKWNKYRDDKIIWDNAVAQKTREKEAKTLMSQGDFAGADKVLKSGKGVKKTSAKKRKSI
jgi:hypothetical protein